MLNLIDPKEYIKSNNDLESLKLLMKIFAENIQPDGVRNRAYLKLLWNRKLNQVTLANNQAYFQSAQSNLMDGGKLAICSNG